MEPVHESAGAAVSVRHVWKSFQPGGQARTLKERLVHPLQKQPRRQVLKDVSFDIAPGESVAFIGTNGCGKSTLLKLLTRILYPEKGTLQTRGKVTSLLELGAGFHPDFTGRENIYFNGAVFGLSRAEIDRRLDDIIAFSELGEAIDDPVRTYSSGMYMRLAFSVAINVDADILLIDEILAVGDQHFQNKCYERLEQLKDADTTVVIVSHALDVIKRLCTRAIWVREGQLRLDGDPAYVIEAYLEQSAKDHREDRRREILKGNQAQALLFLDSPQSFQSLPAGPLLVRGWALAEAEKPELKIFLDEQEMSYTHEPRPDVCSVYAESFAGFLDPDTTGFQCLLEPAPGKHTLRLQLYDGGQLLKEKTTVFESGGSQ